MINDQFSISTANIINPIQLRSFQPSFSRTFNLTSSSNDNNLSQLISEELNDVNSSNKIITNFGKKLNSKFNVGKFLCQRSYGNRMPISSDYGLHHLITNNILKEEQINLGQIDKIYSSCFLDDDFVICGTKCSKLILINLNNKKHYFLPVVQSQNISEKNQFGGIYSIAINPSRTRLATCTKDGNDIAIYSLPSLDVLYLLEKGHTDLIFDINWLDSDLLVSGSRDSKILLWAVKDPDHYEIDPKTDLYRMKNFKPINKFNYTEIDKIRCLNLNRNENEIGVLSFNIKLHLLDSLTMKLKSSTHLQYGTDLVCLTHNESNLYAAGSKSHIQIVDSRSLNLVSTINSKTPECGIRSLSFNKDILTIGTGIGHILFYDLRNSKYFNNQMNEDLICLKTSKGWVQGTNQDNTNYGHFTQQFIDLPAIYTHQYDKNKVRMFVAGGPLPYNLVGNYCAIWY